MIKNINDLILSMATALKMDVAKVKTALEDKDNETEIAFKPEGLKIFTDSELTSREETLKTNHEKAGMEIAIKNLKADTGLEFEGKDPKKFTEAFKEKVLSEANIKESDKIKELNTTIEGLRTNLTNLTNEKETFVKQTKEAQLDTDILTWTIDKKPDNLTNKEWVSLIKMNNEITDHEGVQVVKREGKIVANPVDLKPIAVKDALVSYIDERKIGKAEGGEPHKGRGTGDSKTTLQGITNMKQFNEHLKSQNISPNGAKAQQLLAEITAANQNFDFTPAA